MLTIKSIITQFITLYVKYKHIFIITENGILPTWNQYCLVIAHYKTPLSPLYFYLSLVIFLKKYSLMVSIVYLGATNKVSRFVWFRIDKSKTVSGHAPLTKVRSLRLCIINFQLQKIMCCCQSRSEYQNSCKQKKNS